MTPGAPMDDWRPARVAFARERAAELDRIAAAGGDALWGPEHYRARAVLARQFAAWVESKIAAYPA